MLCRLFTSDAKRGQNAQAKAEVEILLSPYIRIWLRTAYTAFTGWRHFSSLNINKKLSR